MMPLSRNKRIMLDDTDIGLNCLFVLTSVDELISFKVSYSENADNLKKVLLDNFINHQPFICGEFTGYIETFFFIGADNLILSGVYFRMKDSDSFMKRHIVCDLHQMLLFFWYTMG